MIAIGIDPGLSGGIAIPGTGSHLLLVEPMPTLPYGKTSKGRVKRALDGQALAAILRPYAELGAHVFLERVGAMPGQGSASSFSFGMSYWGAASVAFALGMALHLVHPAVWKKHFRLDADKKKAIRLASSLYPGTRLKEGTAEALLIARWGLETSR